MLAAKPAMPPSDLITYVFPTAGDDLCGRCAAWIIESKRFRGFVETYRDKIRKKVRTSMDAETRSDLLAELAVAQQLLSEPRLTVEYERYAAGRTRGPDFSVRFTTRFRFNVEATRIRSAATDAQVTEDIRLKRLAFTVLDKLGQLPPGAINLLWLVVDRQHFTAGDVQGGLRWLKRRAEAGDAQLFARAHVSDTSGFFKFFTRLSGVMVQQMQPRGLADGGGWANPQATHPLPSELRTVLLRMAAPASSSLE